MPVTIEGVAYPSRQAAALAYNVPDRTIATLVRRGQWRIDLWAQKQADKRGRDARRQEREARKAETIARRQERDIKKAEAKAAAEARALELRKQKAEAKAWADVEQAVRRRIPKIQEAKRQGREAAIVALKAARTGNRNPPCVADGVRYESIEAAVSALGIPRTTIRSHIKNPRFPTWHYAVEE